MAMCLVAPSASAMSCWARSWQAAVTAAVSSSLASAATPEAPLASSSTVSLVDMQPSESIRSKVSRVASRSAASSVVGAGDRVGGEHARAWWPAPGASMPAPLAIPPTVQPSPVDHRGLRHGCRWS